MYRSDGDTGATLGDLGRLVADGAVEITVLIVHPSHAAEVDERQLLLGLDDVVGFEVAEEQAAAVKEPERGQDLEHVGDRLVHRQGHSGLLAVPDAELAQRLATDVLHHDVPGPAVLDEVVDAHDVRMPDLGQEPLLRRGGQHG